MNSIMSSVVTKFSQGSTCLIGAHVFQDGDSCGCYVIGGHALEEDMYHVGTCSVGGHVCQMIYIFYLYWLHSSLLDRVIVGLIFCSY